MDGIIVANVATLSTPISDGVSNFTLPGPVSSSPYSSLSAAAFAAVSCGFYQERMNRIPQMLHLYATWTVLHKRAWELRHFLDETEDKIEEARAFYYPHLVALARRHLDQLLALCINYLHFLHRSLVRESKCLD